MSRRASRQTRSKRAFLLRRHVIFRTRRRRRWTFELSIGQSSFEEDSSTADDLQVVEGRVTWVNGLEGQIGTFAILQVDPGAFQLIMISVNKKKRSILTLIYVVRS